MLYVSTGAAVKLQCNNTKYPTVETTKTDKNGYFFLRAPKTITSYAFLLPLSTRYFFFRKCFHENERERARQGAARKEEHERESGLKKLVQIK
jgi:hypothetical protein